MGISAFNTLYAFNPDFVSSVKEGAFTVQESSHSLVAALPQANIIIKSSATNDADAFKISIVDIKTQKIIATAEVIAAEHSELRNLMQLPAQAFTKTLLLQALWLDSTTHNEDLLPTLMYFVLRRGRIMNRQTIAVLVPDIKHPVAQAARLEVLAPISGNQCIAAQDISYAMMHVYEAVQGEYAATLTRYLFDEILLTHDVWVKAAYRGPWAQAIYEGTMSKQQYIWTLYNIHQYVRHTTRIAARCIAFSENMDMRNHFIHHLRGEVNHELLIERDLAQLDADVDYLRTKHVVHHATKDFMVVQESAIGFYHSPFLLLACPLAAEGFTGYLEIQPGFMEALYCNIESWGVKPAKSAATFLTSHIKTDGGDDGHWAMVIDTLKKFIDNEQHLQQFLSVYRAAQKGFIHGLDGIIEDMQIWTQDKSAQKIANKSQSLAYSD